MGLKGGWGQGKGHYGGTVTPFNNINKIVHTIFQLYSLLKACPAF